MLPKWQPLGCICVAEQTATKVGQAAKWRMTGAAGFLCSLHGHNLLCLALDIYLKYFVMTKLYTNDSEVLCIFLILFFTECYVFTL